jgi:hypothetical protein
MAITKEKKRFNKMIRTVQPVAVRASHKWQTSCAFRMGFKRPYRSCCPHSRWAAMPFPGSMPRGPCTELPSAIIAIPPISKNENLQTDLLFCAAHNRFRTPEDLASPHRCRVFRSPLTGRPGLHRSCLWETRICKSIYSFVSGEETPAPVARTASMKVLTPEQNANKTHQERFPESTSALPDFFGVPDDDISESDFRKLIYSFFAAS